MHPDFIEIDDKFSDRETTDREYCLLEQEKQISDQANEYAKEQQQSQGGFN